MFSETFSPNKRSLRTECIQGELVVVGGGVAGVCTAVTAARQGVHVVLVQDRPVLGGNASSEVRLWILGATSHMGNNNRFSREGGVLDEILVENLYRNREGNPVILDTVILEKVLSEKNITLLLNTAVYDVEKSAPDRITRIMGFNSQNATFYEISGKLFCDASGDGIVAYGAGAGFRFGAEGKSEFGEAFAPDPEQFGEVLGHSIYFYSKDTGSPVKFTPPAYALKDVGEAIPRSCNIRSGDTGCCLWWLEHGGRCDTVHDTEQIKWELWSVVYGVWDYIKNSGRYPDAENLTLEWVGIIPGKRESRRFEGLYMIGQQDIISQARFQDAVAYGGWAIDLHPADAVFSAQRGCIQYHSKGVYEIPYRCYVSRDVRNLFFAGRNISASHVAHGSTRVMATSGLGGQAVGMAAALCLRRRVDPAALVDPVLMHELQLALNIAGQSIPHTRIVSERNLAATARIYADSELRLARIPADGPWYRLEFSAAQLLPMRVGVCYTVVFEVRAARATRLEVQLRVSEKAENYTPELVLDRHVVTLEPGVQRVEVAFEAAVPDDRYGFVTFLRNEDVELRMSECRYTGLVSVFNKFNHAVNNNGRQTPPEGVGIDSFEFWCPDRRPAGQNFALEISPALDAFAPVNVVNGLTRPYVWPNAWVANPADPEPELIFVWDEPREIRKIVLYFDTDSDHAMESVQFGHPERVVPFCVRRYTITDDQDRVVACCEDNHQTINRIELVEPLRTRRLTIRPEHPSDHVPAALFQVYME